MRCTSARAPCPGLIDRLEKNGLVERSASVPTPFPPDPHSRRTQAAAAGFPCAARQPNPPKSAARGSGSRDLPVI